MPRIWCAIAGMLLLLASVGMPLSVGADGPTASKATPPPLPPLNARVAEFARSHEGEPVGDGICITLAVAALRDAGAKRFPLNDPAGEYVWGAPVADLKDVLPGDILQFRDAEFRGSKSAGGRRETWWQTYPHHTAVVVGVAENGRLVTICHQNITETGDAPDARGRVRSTTLRMNSLRSGTIRAYRPVAPDSPTNRP